MTSTPTTIQPKSVTKGAIQLSLQSTSIAAVVAKAESLQENFVAGIPRLQAFADIVERIGTYTPKTLDQARSMLAVIVESARTVRADLGAATATASTLAPTKTNDDERQRLLARAAELRTAGVLPPLPQSKTGLSGLKKVEASFAAESAAKLLAIVDKMTSSGPRSPAAAREALGAIQSAFSQINVTTSAPWPAGFFSFCELSRRVIANAKTAEEQSAAFTALQKIGAARVAMCGRPATS